MNFRIESEFEAKVLYEYSVAIEESSYLVIYGKHINGYFCSIPNWGKGCELGSPENVGYNQEKLIEKCDFSEKTALELAKSIEYISYMSK
ncbi:MAG TPA: hypothetical protein IAC14_07970 [Candidatus Scybalomonas excrementigallinarum]|nr:hypothetical protein [Candidatus Scybalomonas excrementigallinarum]